MAKGVNRKIEFRQQRLERNEALKKTSPLLTSNALAAISSQETRNAVSTALAPVSTRLEDFLIANQERLDTANFARYGVPESGLVSQSYDTKAPILIRLLI